ncbi:aminotransferase class I/II-fold pyridoxal phosphate-dependent enzyme [Actinacidiphila sp. bgisy160]|uniref:aminotransferase class I/II-fold pyridoxal phosphate-dependent enzyme n=1 Tax=Actinacidiphila sp. bgisy160 TaxID=3413796 RepID=UPI003D72286A
MAIVGMGCRFPAARNLPEYWRMLRKGERQFRVVPPERWDHAPFHTPQDRRARAGTYTDVIAPIAAVDQFDARHYRMSPRRVQGLDPQHRLLLDASREALQDAGWERQEFDRQSAGVFFGLGISEYMELVPDVVTMQPSSVPGALLSMAAANVSRFFDLRGPSFTVDAACSATLVALHQALSHLATGECRVALVGGAYLTLEPRTLLAFSKVGAISAAGVCRPFDREADGFVLGEGVGVVVLRPLQDALAAGDRVYAVIQGIGASNDGAAAEGPMTPSCDGQMTALRRAYADAGCSPRSIGVFEAHGTATVVGDATELDSIIKLRGEAEGDWDGTACLSSVKSLIGHSLGASGAASLIKSALELHHRTIVPMPETDPARPEDLAGSRLRIPRAVEPWEHPGGRPRRAGVSNFGFGGTNVHVVLEEAPEPSARLRGVETPAAGRRTTGGQQPEEAPGTRDDEPQLFLFSAGSVDRLESHLVHVLETLQDAPDMPLSAIARTLASRRLLTARLAVVAGSHVELRTRVQQARSALAQGRVGTLDEGVYSAVAPLPASERTIAFVFPGQGSQQPGMMRDLYERFPALRSTIDALDALAVSDNGLSLLDSVYGPASLTPEGQERLTGTDVCQPVLGAFGVALARFAGSLGAVPAVTFGHSVGEFPAAVHAGALDESECLRLLLARGARMRSAESVRRGGMLAIRASQDEAASVTQGLEETWAACFIHPRQVVYSGTATELEELARRCSEAGLAATPLRVSNGFHSPLLDSALDDLAADLATRTITRPRSGFVSSVSGAAEDDPAVLRELWGRHASAPVRFGDAARAAYEAGAKVFVQVCGGSGLLGAVRHSVPEPSGVRCMALTADGSDQARTFLATLGELAVLGVDIDAAGLVPEGTPLVTLPPSPLATKSYWYPRVASRSPAPPTVLGLGAEEGHLQPPATRPGRSPDVLTNKAPAVLPEPDREGAAQAPPAAAPPPSSPDHKDSLMHDVVTLLREQLNLLQTFGTAAPVVDRPAASPAAAPPLIQQWAAGMDVLSLPAVEDRDAREPAAGVDFERVRARVYAELSAVSAFPVDQLTDELNIVQELGFDSLMTTELLVRLRRAFPEVAESVTEGFIPRQPTIAQAVEAMAGLLKVDRGAPTATAVLSAAAFPARAEGAVSTLSNGRVAVECAAHTLSEGHSQLAVEGGVAVADPVPAAAVRAESRIEDFPELLEMERRRASLGRSPYFLLHEGTLRDTTRIEGRELISFSGYNYLGLSGHPKVAAAVKEAVDRYGTSVSASRFLSGDRPLHRELESELAALNGCEAAVALVSGHATNVSVIGHLMGPDDLILHDGLAHDSILQGCNLSGARRRPFPHNDMAALDVMLGRIRHHYRRVLIVVEGVYSMDGDIVDLPALIEVKQRHGAMVMIDEAHSIGVVGPHGGGVGDHFAVDRSAVDLWSGTLSKSLAGCGGYVAGTARVVDYLKASVPGFVYSVGMTPANAAASLAALRVLREEPERLQRLRENAEHFLQLARQAGIDTGDSFGSPVIPAIVKDSSKALRLSAALFDAGISVNPILHPAVAEELTRLRFFVTSEHTAQQIESSVSVLASHCHSLNS